MSWIVEVIIGFATIVLGNIFWSTIRGGSFQRNLLQDSEEIRRLIALIGKEKLESEGEAVEPSFGSYSNNIALFLHAGIKALKNTRNIVGIGAIGLFTISVLLNPLFLAINLVLFFMVSLLGIHSYVKNSVATDIHSVLLNIYKWNKEDHDSCKNFCTVEKPYLGVLYQTISEVT
jgi:hypothetical protein